MFICMQRNGFLFRTKNEPNQTSYNLTTPSQPRSRYRIIQAPNNRTTQESNCESDGGKLAQIGDANEQQFLYDQAAGIGTTHLGGYQLPGHSEPDGDWVWHVTRENMTMTEFVSGEPNDNNNQDCFFYYPSFSGGIDFKCNNNYGAICECLEF